MSRNASPRAGEGVAAIGATVVAFGVLATLVTVGALSALDQYAVDHWMPNFEPSSGSGSGSLAHQFYPHLGSPLQVFCNLWTFPASAFVSGTVIAGCCVVLVRRGQRVGALTAAGAWIAANVAEVVGKLVLHRPALHTVEAGMRVSFDNFGHSFPSGHALRAVVTATVLASVWRRAAGPALVWTAVALAALVVGAAHTPSDVFGGVSLALLTLLVARTFLRTRAVAA
jgi:membrane-associated phospholipid phosphatase